VDKIGSINNRDILASGSFVTSGPNETLTFRAADVNFEFTFITNHLAMPSAQPVFVGPHEVKMTFASFDSSRGTAWTGILGNMHSRLLYLAVVVYLLGDTATGQRFVHYTLSLQR
jgi:hypothetical protein